MRQRDAVIDEEFDSEHFALRCHALAVLDDVASFLQERTCFPQ
jgi:hypothetical protein